MYLQILFVEVLMNLSATADIPSLNVEYTSILLFCKNDIIDLL